MSSGIRIDVTGDKLEHAEKMLAGVSGGIEKAVRSAMSRSASNLRSSSTKEIRKRYDISASAIRAEENVKTTYSYSPGLVSAFITFSGKKIPLYRYNGASPKLPTVNPNKFVTVEIGGKKVRVHPGIPAQGHQFTSTAPEKFDNVFTATMSNGHTGLFERNGKKDRSISEKMGSSVPTMVSNDEVRENLAKGAWEKFEERLDHEVLALMNGWR